MLNYDTQTIMFLGLIIIIILLLLILIQLSFGIRKKQKLILDSHNMVLEAIETLQITIVKMDSSIIGNFAEVMSKTIILDSKVMSISDMGKDISKAISANHNKTMNSLGGRKKSNKPHRDTNNLDRTHRQPKV